ncbi:MAG: hypothetical protein IT423_14830 [Pirellulaceae bacterium]|nr:hypothetical protein [Pirellulaceae bacterium]
MSQDPPMLPALVCQKCGATNPPHATTCWLCNGTDDNPYSAPPSQEPNLLQTPVLSPTQSRVEIVFMLLLAVTIGFAGLVGIGIAVQDPGMLVPFLIIVGPAFIATGSRALVSVAKGERPKASALFVTLLWSGMFTALTIALLVVSAVIALFLMCAQMLGR